MNKGAAKLRELIESGGHTQSSIGKAVGVFQSAVSRWASGTDRRPEPEYRAALERLYGIPAADWMTDDERRIAFGEPSAVPAPERVVVRDEDVPDCDLAVDEGGEP